MDNNFYNDNNNNDVKAENNQHNQDGFYSYKRPETANNPDYSAINNNASYIPPVLPKKPKQKRKVSLGSLVACCLICSILASTLSIGVMYGVSNFTKIGNAITDKINGTDSDSNNSDTIINVSQESSIATAVAKKVVPSVVGIVVTPVSNSIFDFYNSSSQGSGVIYSEDGYIITNYHVISMAVTKSAKIAVYLSDDAETAIDARVVGYYSDSDLAVIKIDKKGLSATEFADSDKLNVGDVAIAVGNPGGLEFMGSVSCGIVSGLNRTMQMESTSEAMKLIQTDAAINPGNSGGALVNAEGKLIGINSSKIASESYEGMGFAIPSNYVKKLVDNIIKNKDVNNAYLGLTISSYYTSEMLQRMGYPKGVVVEEVASNSPAENAGIKKYDVITSFNGVDISDVSGYNKEKAKYKSGDRISLTVYRNGNYYNASVTLDTSVN